MLQNTKLILLSKKLKKNKLNKYLIIILTSCFIFYSKYYLPNFLAPSYIEIEKYIKCNLEGKLLHSKLDFYKRPKPKISVIISVFNGEVYLKPAVRSIQNQNFLNIEIIIVNDGSLDNTINVVKDLMEEDRRIK